MRKSVTVLLSVSLVTAIVFVMLSPRNFSMDRSHVVRAVVGERIYKHEFRLRNYSLKRIIVQSVQSSCGCTVVAGVPHSVAPFKLLTVPVEVNTAGRSGDFESTIVVSFDNNVHATLAFRTYIVPPLPDVIDMGIVRKGYTSIQEFALLDEEQIDISDHLGSNGESMSLMEIGRVNGIVRAQFELKAPITSGKFELRVPLRAEGREISIIGRVMREIEPEFDVVSLGYYGVDQQDWQPRKPRVIRFVSASRESFQWRQDLTQHSRFLKLTIGEEKEILAELLGPLPAGGLFSETVRFVFDVGVEHPRSIEVEVRFYAYVIEPIGENYET